MARLQSDQEIEEILHLALNRRGQTEDDLRLRLLETGTELGLSPDEIADAERAYYAKKVEARFSERKNLSVDKSSSIHSGSLAWAGLSALGFAMVMFFQMALVTSGLEGQRTLGVTLSFGLIFLFGWVVYRAIEGTRKSRL